MLPLAVAIGFASIAGTFVSAKDDGIHPPSSAAHHRLADHDRGRRGDLLRPARVPEGVVG